MSIGRVLTSWQAFLVDVGRGEVPLPSPLHYVAAVTFNIVRDLNTTTVDSSNAAVSVSLDGVAYYPCSVAGGAASCTVTDNISFEDVTSVGVLAYDLQDTGS